MRVAALAIVALAGCSRPDITGIYQTTRAAFDVARCDAQTATTTPAFFVVRQGEFQGVTFLTVRGCATADLASCSAAGPTPGPTPGAATVGEAPLTLAVSDGWEGQADAAEQRGGACKYSRTEVRAVQADDLSLTVEASRRETDRMTTVCAAEDVPEDMPCVAAQVVAGPRVADAPPGGASLGR